VSSNGDHDDHGQGSQRGPSSRDGEEPQGPLDGRGHRSSRRRLSHHRRLAEGLRRRPRHRLAVGESAIVGTAVGLAIRGYRAVCEIQFDGFVYPAFDQIVSQVAKLHKRSDGAYNMAMVIRIPFQGGIGAIEHHSESPEPYFAQTAGLRVVSCSTPNDAYWMIQQSIECDDPIIFCEPKSRYWEKGEVDLETPPPDSLTPVVRREGTDVTLVGYGASMKTALRAAETAAVEGTSIEVIDARSIAPLDIEVMAKSLEKTGRVVVVQESPHTASIGSEIISELTQRCFYSLKAPVFA